MYEYLPIEQAKPGDVVEHQGETRSDIFGSDKKLCIVTEVRDDTIYTNVKPDEWFYKEYFRLIKTRQGSEAKIGDTVLCIKKSINYTEGDVYCVTDREDCSDIAMLKDSNHTTCSSSSVYFRVLCKAEPESTEKRNLAFYKRSGEPWTNEECESVIRYVGSEIQIKNKDWGNITPTFKYMYDSGGLSAYMGSWSRQEKGNNFKNCKQVAYEDMFDAPYPEENINIFIPVLAKSQLDYLNNCKNICHESPFNPATSCSQLTPIIPEEEPMLPTTENITISMTAKEYAKFEKQDRQARPISDLELEYKKPFNAKVFDEDGKYLSKLFAKSQKKLDAAISEHLHRNRFDIIVDSTTHKTSKAARAEVVQS